MNFIPGDRLRSKKSGIIYIYILETVVAPEGTPADYIPVRDELWSGNYYWLPESLFVKVDDDFPDAAKGMHAN